MSEVKLTPEQVQKFNDFHERTHTLPMHDRIRLSVLLALLGFYQMKTDATRNDEFFGEFLATGGALISKLARHQALEALYTIAKEHKKPISMEDLDPALRLLSKEIDLARAKFANLCDLIIVTPSDPKEIN